MVRVMASAGAITRLRAIRPLSPEEWAEAERVAARLHGELRRLIAGLPEHARHASGMSRHLDVLRATCQRVVQAVQDVPASPLLLAKLPGVEGLRQFLEGFTRVGADEIDTEAVQSAIEGFERLITATGGSQTKLIDRLNAGTAARSGEHAAPGAPMDREALFHAAAAVTGRRCDTSLSIYAFRISPENPVNLERALAKGLIGSVVTPGGLPMVLGSGDTLKGDEEVRRLRLLKGEGVQGRTPEAILKPFSTDPLPMVTSRGKRGTLFQVIDPNSGLSGEAFDVVTAVRGTHPVIDPQTNLPSLDAVWSLVNCPTAKLVLDVYLHADMERSYRPSLEALLWQPDLNIPEEQRWIMRVPSQPRLQLLGRGAANSATECYLRHTELTQYFFDHIGWDPEEFVGFRCEVIYPVWRAGYCMAFEHLGGTRTPE